MKIKKGDIFYNTKTNKLVEVRKVHHFYGIKFISTYRAMKRTIISNEVVLYLISDFIGLTEKEFKKQHRKIGEI